MVCKLNGGSVLFEFGFNIGKLYSLIFDVSKLKKKNEKFVF